MAEDLLGLGILLTIAYIIVGFLVLYRIGLIDSLASLGT